MSIGIFTEKELNTNFFFFHANCHSKAVIRGIKKWGVTLK